MAELLARVRALVRRRERLVPEVISFAGLSLDLSAYTLSLQGTQRAAGQPRISDDGNADGGPRRIISTAQFMERVWGWDAEVDVSIVWVYVSNLRKKIAQLGADVEIAPRGAWAILWRQRHDPATAEKVRALVHGRGGGGYGGRWWR